MYVPYSNFLGYDKGTNKYKMVINEEEAKLVKKIYSLFLRGYSSVIIAKKLTEMNIKTPSGRQNWNASTIRSILENEKYKGDALLQKEYTIDFLRKKQVKNNGVLPKYYVTDEHPAIIDRDVFDYVQNEMNRRKSYTRYVGIYSMSGKIICGDCKGHYGRNNQHSTTYGDLVWKCRNRHKNGCKTPRMFDYILNETLDLLLKRLLTDDLLNILDEIMETKDLCKNVKSDIKTRLSDWDFIIKEIVVTNDWKIKIKLINDKEYTLKHNKATPRMKTIRRIMK